MRKSNTTSSPKRKPWGGGGGTKRLTSDELKDETRRVEELYTKLKIEKERVKQLAESVGLGLNGVKREGNLLNWPQSAAPLGVVRSTRDLLGAKKVGGLAALADLSRNGGGNSRTLNPKDGDPRSEFKKRTSLSPSRLMELAEASIKATGVGARGGRGSGFSAVAAQRIVAASASPQRPSPLCPLVIPSPHHVTLSIPPAASWDVERVCDWLEECHLSEYRDVFKKNAVNGTTLLELGASDLDYLGITPLGHRKLIIKGVEALKGGEKSFGGGATLAHWSHIPPQGGGAGEGVSSGITSNLLDGELDEAAERRSFQAAVMAWRGATKVESNSPKSYIAKLGDGEWVNPFNSGSNNDEKDNGYREGSLLEGSFDEVAEAKAFSEAVLAWRSGGNEKDGTINGKNRKADQASSGARSACYQCFRVFLAATGSFSPPPEPQLLNKKSFCSSKCHSVAATALLAREEVVEAALAGGEFSDQNLLPLSSQQLFQEFDILSVAVEAGEMLVAPLKPPDSPQPAHPPREPEEGGCDLLVEAEEAALALLKRKNE